MGYADQGGRSSRGRAGWGGWPPVDGLWTTESLRRAAVIATEGVRSWVHRHIEGNLDGFDLRVDQERVDRVSASTDVARVPIDLRDHDPGAIIRPPEVRPDMPAVDLEAARRRRVPGTGSSCDPVARPPLASRTGVHPALRARTGSVRLRKARCQGRPRARARGSIKRRCPPTDRTMRSWASWCDP